jgi:UDP-N-acetylmuramyl pentapeptide phosphotransferase/UDP-N-acetylglucosamine-1-phosphate transferase
MRVVVALIVGFLAVRFLRVAGLDFLRIDGLQRENFRGRRLPTAAGVLIVLSVLMIEAGRALAGAAGAGDKTGLTDQRAFVLFACFGFGLLGLVDDLVGSGDDRGFRGHLVALSQGRITTGLVKLFGGAGVAIVLVATPGFASGRRLIIDAVLIALAANLGNLLDRAPGRAIKAAFLAYVPLAIACGTGAVGVAIAPVMGAGFGLLVDDLHEHLMLGDTGANVLGAVLGLGAVMQLGEDARLTVMLALLALNVLSELVSFSALIERVPPLRAADRLGRTRS